MRGVLPFGCRFLLAAVFLMAGVTKVTDLQGFADRVLLHSPLPAWLGWAVAVFLPWLELTCGLCLALGRAVREAAALTAILLVLFLTYGLFDRGGADCGCFVFIRNAALTGRAWWYPVRNLLLLASSVPVFWSRSGGSS